MTRLLLFSDVHGDAEACTQLVKQASDADVVVGAGDFCVMRRNLREPIGRLAEIDVPTVLVPGNAETKDELKEACSDWSSARVLHGEGCTVDGISFYGIGGGIPVTPFGPWSYDFSEEQAENLLADCPDGAVLVSHSPPKGAVDRDSKGTSLGSVEIRNAIEKTEPVLTVCGHIHGSWGEEETVGSTPVVNAGPKGQFRTIDV